MYYDSFESPLGKIHLLSDEAGLRHLTLCLHHPFEPSREWKHAPKQLAPYKTQLLEFLAGKRFEFTVPLAPDGTEFQHQVWRALRAIPYGETRTYAQIANEIGNPHACRAVGMANNVNPLPLIVPCHRVIGSDGQLTGYRYGLTIKKKLLEIEKNSG
ncbi:methylated-DNA--[protein]-cysteine S-methyltransferase [Enterovibrio nigricans]|uniref:Methylated-DNA--protein-cysteine methyltransferase n=1 Tax=Enterovibrio nigricans DSM 22720 TaxID=1121868 RepID=A0A1T4U525_9GAMM|nr:methylated-DNA--[protein]-cysteine S-methyltransferase [Enterovibrio nigricans]PKF50539.1 6-O-methylguanine DNA methyltransferase [Enterovibrio nigricans]SKA47767.1 methylated-DNA-[protein]-cysteine S-methyltransferase [Enterovibrio nigricans DSM 22720]